MKLITGIGEPLIGRVLLYDALSARTRELTFHRDPSAAAVTELIDYEQFCGGGADAPESVDAQELKELLRAESAPVLLDVRTDAERLRVRIAGSRGLPLDDLEREVPELTDPIVVYCERDPRSIRAVRLLQESGHRDVRYLRGGIQDFAGVAAELLVSED